MNQVRCPNCGMKQPVMLQGGQLAAVWCRSKQCRGKWVIIDTRVPANIK